MINYLQFLVNLTFEFLWIVYGLIFFDQHSFHFEAGLNRWLDLPFSPMLIYFKMILESASDDLNIPANLGAISISNFLLLTNIFSFFLTPLIKNALETYKIIELSMAHNQQVLLKFQSQILSGTLLASLIFSK